MTVTEIQGGAMLTPLATHNGDPSTIQPKDLLPVYRLGLGDPERRELFISVIRDIVKIWSDPALVCIENKRCKTDTFLRDSVDQYCKEVGILPVMTSVVGEDGYADQGLAFKLKDWGILTDWSSVMLKPGSEFCARLTGELRKAEVSAILIGQCCAQKKSERENQADIFTMLIAAKSRIRDIGGSSLAAQAVPFIQPPSVAFDPKSEDNGVERCLELMDGKIVHENVVDTYLAPIRDSLKANFSALKIQLGLGKSDETVLLKGAMLLPSGEDVAGEAEAQEAVYCQPNRYCELVNLYVKVASRVPLTKALRSELDNKYSELAEQQMRFVEDKQPDDKIDLWLTRCLHLPLQRLDDAALHALSQSVQSMAQKTVAAAIAERTSMKFL
ncbi:hypothetical protein ACVBEF_03240 [Glaciimonas sp. GG7]